MKLKEVFKFFKTYFKSEKKTFIIGFIIIFINSIIGVSYGLLMGNAIEFVTIGAYPSAVFFLLIYLLFGIIDSLFLDKIGNILINKGCINMMEKISYEVFYKVGLLPARAFEEKSSGELINRIVNDSGTITDTFKQAIRTIIALWTTIVVFIYIIINSRIIALEIMIYLLIFYIISKKFLPKIKENQKGIQKEKDKSVAEVNETIRGIREIRALGIREKMNINIKATVNIIFNKTKTQMIDERSYFALIMSLDNILEVIVFLTCIILIYFKISSLAFFISMTYYLYKFMYTVDNVMDLSSSYQKMAVSIERVDEILNNKTYKDETFGNVHNTKVIGDLKFINVKFKYSNEETFIFNNLNLTIKPNRQIAIVGKSGQGKTSIFNLILRYFEPISGSILLDSVPLKEYDEISLRKNIAIIRQDPFIFNKTILENFLVLDYKLTLKKIREACALAEIDDYIMSTPKKYKTVIGEGGINLSGGQKQRLAIARALLKESKILLFDEATSALDNENQEKIKKVIKNLSKDHTIIVVAHRLSTIIDADEIIVLDKGKVIATGTHNELIDKCSIYKKLYLTEM
ncbi:MAG: ABC transporter ATP-binding protein [Bacilli bacterium]